MLLSQRKRLSLARNWEGPGIAPKTHKSGVTGASLPDSWFVKTDKTDYVYRMKQVRKRVLRRTYGI